MKKSESNIILKTLVLITYLGMVFVNALANILPINGITTADVSNAYPNLFVPTGITFAIWGLIYLLLGGFAIYQLGLFQKNRDKVDSTWMNTVRKWFCLSSVANILWIFSWHYQKIALSLLFMVTILLCLIFINQLINKEDLSLSQKIFVQIPFSVYFGWITVAAIANVTAFLVSLHWNGFGISAPIWTVFILIVGMLIGALTTYKNKDAAYGFVIVWAYIGIFVRHASANGFAFEYPWIVYTVLACIAILVVTSAYVLFKDGETK